MTFIEAVIKVLTSQGVPMTPQDIREMIINLYPAFYGTASHKRNVKRGHYQSIDHALLARIYGAVRTSKSFFCDKATKPMKISLVKNKKQAIKAVALSQQTKRGGNMNTTNLINNQREYFSDSYAQFTAFGGPCVYFHRECLRAGQDGFMSERHLEMLYATLTAWGLHRMGDAKAKLTEWDIFSNSLLSQANALRQFLPYRMIQFPENEYSKLIYELRPYYKKLNLSISGATVVVNSKALHHLFPELIPPIDRQYTIRFFTKTPDQWLDKKGKFRPIQLPPDFDEQFNLFHKTCVDMRMIASSIDPIIFDEQHRQYDVTIPKAIDNAIVNYVRKVSGGLTSA